MLTKLLMFCSLAFANAKDANVLMTEVFAIPLDPPMFNWTYEGIKNQFEYQASLLNAPDLPSWINYIYSEQHRSGFLFGVSPKITDNVALQIVALNKKTYETRVEILNIIVSEKLNSARFEVHLKIDNLNVEDLFDVDRMESLKDVFRKELWKNSAYDLYVTLLSSAIELGARKPPNPREGEGVVIRLGSETPFSTELIELQKEVRPLSNMVSCPRNYKKTSVERYFREAGFVLDWCSFNLITHNSSMYHFNENLLAAEQNDYFKSGDIWQSISKLDVPQRSYYNERMVSLLVPVVILIVVGSLLTFLLCFNLDLLEDEESEIYFYNLFHICMDYYYDHYIYKRTSHINELKSDQINYPETIHRPSESIRGFNRETTLSPDLCSHSNSPNSTINRGVHCRPSPPPYVRPRGTPDL